jgi:hypothetical protein
VTLGSEVIKLSAKKLLYEELDCWLSISRSSRSLVGQADAARNRARAEEYVIGQGDAKRAVAIALRLSISGYLIRGR